MTRKLKWYAENQELLDKSTRTIKSKEEELHRLKLRIEELQTEVPDLDYAGGGSGFGGGGGGG